MAPSLKIPVNLDMNALRSQGQQAADFISAMLGTIQSNFDSTNSQIASSTNGAFSQIGGGVSSVTLALGGATGAAAGLLLALTKISSEVASIATAAQYLNTTTENFQALKFVGQTAGLSGAQSTKDLENVARLLNDAQRNENSLSKLLAENNVKYKDRNGQLVSINDLLAKGSQLVANAGSYADKVEIAKMLGLSQQWVPVLEQGADKFRDIANGAEAAGVIIDRETIAKAQLFDDAWRSSADALSTQFKSAFIDVADYIDTIIAKVGEAIKKAAEAKGLADGETKFNAMADAAEILARQELGVAQNLDQVSRALDNAKTKNLNPEIIDTLQAIYDKAKKAADAINAVAAASYTADGSPLPRARPAGAGVPTNPTKIPSKDTDSESKFETAEDRIKKRTKEYEAETAAVGLDTGAKVRLKAIADLNAAADAEGITLTEKQRQEVLQLADAEGKAAQTAADATQKWRQQNELIRFGGDQMISIMDGLRNGTLTAAKAVNQLANAFITAAEKALLLGEGPLAGLFGTAAAAGSGGTGGLLGMIFGGFRAGGGSVNSGSSYVVGENGPEIFTPNSSGSIIPNGVSPAGGRFDGTIMVHVVPNDDRFNAYVDQRAQPIAAGAAQRAAMGSVSASKSSQQSWQSSYNLLKG